MKHDEIISLEYGSGGKKTSAIIDELILPMLGNKTLNELSDGARISFKNVEKINDIQKSNVNTGSESREQKFIFSTDSFVINPYFFPGGDIGKLAVCGTVNDISVSGGIPEFLSLSAIIEEGFPVEDLKTIINSIKEMADDTGVKIVTGDTKVVERGKGDGIYLNTSGVGLSAHDGLSAENISEGDAVIVSGPLGNHEMAVMLARNSGLLKSNIISDCAPVCRIAKNLFSLKDELKIMRDPTRGGLATVLCELLESYDIKKEGKDNLCIEIDENTVPMDADVRSACEILGLDPLYLACEGRIVMIVSNKAADSAISLCNKEKDGKGAKIIGHVTKNYPKRVILNTKAGGRRIITKLAGSQLPRIC